MKKSFAQFVSVALISFVAFGIVWGLSHLKIIESLEATTFDLRQIAFAPETKASPDIVMIWLDEKTMAELPYRSPVPRDFLTELNNKLLEAEPKLIAYDIFLKDPSYSDYDNALAASFSQGQVYAVMPMRMGGCAAGKSGTDGCADLPLPLFRETIDGLGLADLPFNPFDSVVRYAKYNFSTDLGKTPSFAALIFEKATGKSAAGTISDDSNWPQLGSLKLTPFAKPTGETFIRFAGPPSKIGGTSNTFKIFSAQLLAKGLVPADWLKGKIILVGAAYEDLQDAYLTPYFAKFTGYARMNGVEIHSNILSNLLTSQFYYTFEPRQLWILAALIIILVAAAASSYSPFKSSFIFLLTLGALIGCAVLFFRRWAIVVPVVIPGLGVVTGFGLGIGWKAITEGRQRKWIKQTFAQYVPPTVVARLIENPELVKLGGEKRTITSLFTDIASFTSISERLNPDLLVKFLNEYLSRMNEILFRHGGTIDKYEGDAVIAFFNAPLDVSDHEMAAVRSAIEIQNASNEITSRWESICGRPILTRVGINTGEAVVGNMGSESRFDYTAIGDTVNLASRLEGANKFYGTRVMVSERTAKAIDKSVIIRPLDRVRVKGKSDAVLLYEVMGPADDPDFEPSRRIADEFASAFAKFEERSFDEAEPILRELLRIYMEDGPSRELLARCAKARENPAWDLVTELVSK